MKNYETPVLKEEKVEIEDIVAASAPAVTDHIDAAMDKLFGWGAKPRQ